METVELVFEEHGVATNPPLLILHGFFAYSRNWRQIAEKLAQTYHVYTLDARNHGASPHHAIMDYPSMAADVARFIEQHELSTVTLLAHSMGGKTAMWFALTYPHLLEQLIVVDIAPVPYKHSFAPLVQTLQNL